MKPRLRLDSLTLLGSRKNYVVSLKDGFNLISGPTSTGKTSILEMIDYALGAKSHKAYIEIGNSCSHVELVIDIGIERYQIRRQLFDFNAEVIVSDWNEEKQDFHVCVERPHALRCLLQHHRLCHRRRPDHGGQQPV